ncbi:hypothetical protein [Tabrizicola sp.]|uniref:hypothetical protein n=1 Tax=Tabrizicola sp. TaxID=2005166 RepID=UPI0026283A85|nr:hypothetical protein [Tabrizicola sp.]MDM7932868.1 hypothetical protein [Tabrizicola sp.]
MSVLDQIRDLEKQRAELVKEAKAVLLAAAEKAVAELNELGKELGFSYSLREGNAPAARTTTGSTGNRKQMSETDILEAQKDMLAFLKGKKADQQSQTEIFDGLGYEQSRHQTMQKHLKDLLASGHIEATVKDTSKGKSPKNPTAYLWVKDLDN